MAEHLASIFGTEKDRVNCPFYFKIGACRHGDRCSRLHNRPTISPTLLLSNMYQRPDMATPGLDTQGQNMDPRKVQQHFEDFFEDMYEELSKYGELESLNVCDNLADHMVGNVYVQFQEEEQAAAALQALSGRFYAGRPILVDFSPVTDFREATCRQYEENTCNRGGYCNFMHLKKIGRDLRRKLFGYSKNYGRSHSRSRSRSCSPHKEFDKHDYQYDWRGGRGYDRRYDGRDDRRMDYYDRRLRGGGYRRSPTGHRRSHSPGSRRSRGSPVREGSPERRARIEQWNRERENTSRMTDTHRDREANWNRDQEEPQEAGNGDVASANGGAYGKQSDGLFGAVQVHDAVICNSEVFGSWVGDFFLVNVPVCTHAGSKSCIGKSCLWVCLLEYGDMTGLDEQVACPCVHYQQGLQSHWFTI